MNELRKVSNGVLAKGDNTLRVQKDKQLKEKQEHQLMVKKHNIIIREIPDEFIDMMQKAHNNVFLAIDVGSDDYQTAKKLTNLFWIRAIKNKRNKVIFKETKLGKKIMDTIKPQKKSNNLLDDIIIGQLFIGFFTTIVSGLIALATSNPFEYSTVSSFFGHLALVGFVILFLVLIPIVIQLFLPMFAKPLTVGNCTKVAKTFLNKHDIKFEHQYLIKYSKKHEDIFD